MRGRSRLRWGVPGLAAAAVLVLGGCASTHAPEGLLPGADAAPADPFGAWAQLEYRHSGEFLGDVSGELIAVSADSLYVLPPQGLLAVALSDIDQARVEFFDPPDDGIAAWALLGSLSTPSHGYFLVFSLPLWIITGSAAVSGQTGTAIIEYPDESLAGFADYARFPAGLPPGVDRAALTPRRAAPAP